MSRTAVFPSDVDGRGTASWSIVALCNIVCTTAGALAVLAARQRMAAYQSAWSAELNGTRTKVATIEVAASNLGNFRDGMVWNKGCIAGPDPLRSPARCLGAPEGVGG